MPLDTKKTIKLSELIHWVKKELFSDEAFRDDPVPLFAIDEVTVEVNFVLSGGGKAGLNLQVVKAGTEVTEERVQKAIVRMKPLVSYERVRDRLGKEQLEHLENEVARVLVKGRFLPEQDVPPRE
jgi:hypothetical protein